MSKRYRASRTVALPAAVLFACQTLVALNGPPPNMQLVICSGFENNVSYAGNTLRGIDASVSGPGNNWNDLGDIQFRTLIEQTGRIAIVAAPENSQNKMFKVEILTPTDKKGRAQGSFVFERPENYDRYYCRFRWFIPDDWQLIRELNPHGWTDFFEIWSRPFNADSLIASDGAGSFRLNFSFEETGSTSNVFEWHLKGHNRTYTSATGKQEWVRTNSKVAVPFGSWSTLELYVQKGPDPKTQPKSHAHITIRLKPDGGSWQTLFDVTDERTEHSTHPQPGYLRFQPFKNYTQKSNVDYLLSKGKRVYFLYDDFEFWAGKYSEATMVRHRIDALPAACTAPCQLFDMRGRWIGTVFRGADNRQPQLLPLVGASSDAWRRVLCVARCRRWAEVIWQQPNGCAKDIYQISGRGSGNRQRGVGVAIWPQR